MALARPRVVLEVVRELPESIGVNSKSPVDGENIGYVLVCSGPCRTYPRAGLFPKLACFRLFPTAEWHGFEPVSEHGPQGRPFGANGCFERGRVRWVEEALEHPGQLRPVWCFRCESQVDQPWNIVLFEKLVLGRAGIPPLTAV